MVDDIIVWWVDDERFDVMPNASNTTDVLGAIGGSDVTTERARDRRSRAPRRGPAWRWCPPEAATVHRFAVERFEWGGATCLVAGTGYTGEEGVECAVPAEVAADFWDAVLGQGVVPAGLGAATRSASRRASRCMATSSVPASRRCRRAWAGCRLGQGRFHRPGRPRRGAGQRSGPAPAGLRGRRAAAAAGRLPAVRGPGAGRHPDQRQLLADAGTGHRPGLCRRRRAAARRGSHHHRPAGPGTRRRLVRPPLWPIREESE